LSPLFRLFCAFSKNNFWKIQGILSYSQKVGNWPKLLTPVFVCILPVGKGLQVGAEKGMSITVNYSQIVDCERFRVDSPRPFRRYFYQFFERTGIRISKASG
jgi:hypothetical protein